MKTVRGLVAAALAAIALASCASMRAPSSDADTALIIAVKHRQDADFASFGHYRIRILNESNQTATSVDVGESASYDIVFGLPPGKYSIPEMTFVYNSNLGGRTFERVWRPDISFELEPRKATILGKTFVLRKYIAEGQTKTHMDGYWDPLTQEVARALPAELWSTANFRQWSLSSGSLANPALRQAYAEISGGGETPVEAPAASQEQTPATFTLTLTVTMKGYENQPAAAYLFQTGSLEDMRNNPPRYSTQAGKTDDSGTVTFTFSIARGNYVGWTIFKDVGEHGQLASGAVVWGNRGPDHRYRYYWADSAVIGDINRTYPDWDTVAQTGTSTWQ